MRFSTCLIFSILLSISPLSAKEKESKAEKKIEKSHKKIGKEAIKTAKEHYSVESTANRYFELILDEFSKKKKGNLTFINKMFGFNNFILYGTS